MFTCKCRLDRSNKYIDYLDEYLKFNLKKSYWIDMCDLDDEFENLKVECIMDGLHLSKKEYEVFRILLKRRLLCSGKNCNNSSKIWFKRS